MLMSNMKQITESYLKQKAFNAVFCVPAYFNHTQRKCIRDASELAGLNVLQANDDNVVQSEGAPDTPRA